MQWNQIKTLFILCFLVLNIYLLYLLLDKQKEADIGIIEREDATIEEQLESENITYNPLPDANDKEGFLSVEQKVFDDEDKKNLEKFNNQESVILDDNFIISEYVEPIKIPRDASDSSLSNLIKDNMLYAEEYKFWTWNEEFNVLVYFQEKNERPIYFNRNGIILVFLDENNETTSYIQTMLGDAEEAEEKKSLIQPIKAIETLYLTNQLNAGEKVTNTNIGYHTRVPLADGIQVFVPTWKVSVDDERNYFINAIEGFTFSGNDGDFLKETIEAYTTSIRSATIENKELKEEILKQLSSRLDTDGSEE